MMKKKTKHFVPNKNYNGSGYPACNGYTDCQGSSFLAYAAWGEIAKTRRSVTCGNCRRTRIFRKIK